MNTQEYFDQNKYVILSDVISEEEAARLTQHMFNLHSQGKLENDEQCPLSDAVYGDPEFDALLDKLCVPLGKQLGRELIPTYTYSRIYRPGEILKKHTDRPSCEISATLTLGYDSKSKWPIYFLLGEKETPIQMEVGEMAVYQGCELVHWRPAFKGNWHVQVFLHYVDANGPYADHAFDKRGGLSNHSVNVEEKSHVKPELTRSENLIEQKPLTYNVPNPVHGATHIPSVDESFPGYFSYNSEFRPELTFTAEECERIIDIARENYPSTASVGGNNQGKVQKQIRSADIYNIENIPELRWIFDKIATDVYIANKEHFDYDANIIQHSLQLIHYKADEEVPGHYSWHADSGPGTSASRKISFICQLTDPEKYEGCELEVFDHGGIVVATKERGSVHMFPSYMIHRVKPITKGERWALVIWIHGSRRFK